MPNEVTADKLLEICTFLGTPIQNFTNKVCKSDQIELIALWDTAAGCLILHHAWLDIEAGRKIHIAKLRELAS